MVEKNNASSFDARYSERQSCVKQKGDKMDDYNDNEKGPSRAFQLVSSIAQEDAKPSLSTSELLYSTYKGTIAFSIEQYKNAQQKGAAAEELRRALQMTSAILGSVPDQGAKDMLIDDLKRDFAGDDLLLRQIAQEEGKLRDEIKASAPDFN